ncbi:putative NBD/HSP70 family sugar kinase [Herbihabitans rhizosphaerae]|uniref:Putative NBD/HSP70 family sugar kinase n=1 Tax=Herbihabitans rhizosphaerae TaxID=1872711 RepID=A0A4Q7L3N4_9PSEU|nr:ROK family transcriptional regulator [Herbihabitans rhizosphaerae]RZS43071.1 putative NBD/HSP70 family sugar kinase [Herbihabitans rhizosphaerae]
MSDEPRHPNAASPGQLLRLLLDGAPRTRAELTLETGLARSTVRTRLDALLDAGFVRDRSGVSTGGRPAGQVVFNARARIVLAAEVGATHATLAVTDLTDSPLATSKLRLDIADGPKTVLSQLVQAWRELLKRDDLAAMRVAGIGIGLPGPVEHSSGRPKNPPIMPGWDGYDVPARVGAEFGVPVLVDNEVNLMALGEHTKSFPDADDMIVVKVATGIGSGFISNGVLHRGAVGAAGDLGHVAAPRGGEVLCRCGNSGCLEAIASGPAIATSLRAKGIAAQTSSDVVALVRSGNLEASQAVRQAGRDIGDVLAACVSMFNPSLIVVGGSLAAAGEMLLAGVRESIYRRSLPLATEHLRIIPAQVGVDAGVLGAAAMVIQHALSPAEVDRQLA